METADVITKTKWGIDQVHSAEVAFTKNLETNQVSVSVIVHLISGGSVIVQDEEYDVGDALNKATTQVSAAMLFAMRSSTKHSAKSIVRRQTMLHHTFANAPRW